MWQHTGQSESEREVRLEALAAGRGHVPPSTSVSAPDGTGVREWVRVTEYVTEYFRECVGLRV